MPSEYDDYSVAGDDDSYYTVASAAAQDFAASNAGGQKTFEIKVQRPMAPDRIILQAALAPSLNVVSAIINGTNILGSAASIPGDVFRHDSTVRLRTPVMLKANDSIFITLENWTTAAVVGVKPAVAGIAQSIGK